jgi:hypothetical protein
MIILRINLIDYIEEEEKWLEKTISYLNDNEINHYKASYKYLRELINAKIFYNNIEKFYIVFDEGCIFITIDFHQNIEDYEYNKYIDLSLYIEKSNNIEYGNIIIQYLDKEKYDNYNTYPWTRIVELIKKSNNLEELFSLRNKYLNSDLYQKEQYPY